MGCVRAGAFFEVADREFDDGVFAVEPVGFDHVEVAVGGDERVVSPLGPQPALGWFGEPGATHDQADGAGLRASSPVV